MCLFCPTWFTYNWSRALFCREQHTVILVPFMAILSMIMMSSLKDQYGCTSSTSASVDGQPCITYTDSMPKCSSARVASLVSSAVMQSGISVHDSTTFMVMHIPGISSSLSCGCAWIAKSTVNSCGPGLYRIPMLYWWMHNNILCYLCDRVTTSFLKIATSCYHQLSCWLCGQSSSGWIFLGHVTAKFFSFCYYNGFCTG